MRRLRALWMRLTGLVGRTRAEEEFSAELESHLTMHIDAGIRAGLSKEEARRQALIRLGGIEQARQAGRERRTLPRIEALLADLRYAVRQSRKSPGHFCAAVLTLALGIGANTAVFSVVQGVLLRPLPYKNPERLVVVWQTDAAHRASGEYFDTYREFEAWQQNSKSFEHLAALSWATNGSAILWHDKPVDLLAIPASTDFFAMLGASPQMGRTFSASDLRNACTLVLAHTFWEHELGAPRDIVGQTLSFGHQPCQVVGVMPLAFAFYPVATGAWTLITPASDFARKPWPTMTGVFGLLKPGVMRASAEAELNAIQARVLPEAPANLTMMRTLNPDVLDLQSNFTWLAGRNLRNGLWVVLVAAGIILLIACLNVAILLLGRGVERAREMAVRVALGSGRARLLSQLLAEALLLAATGAVVGVLLAVGLLRWFQAANPIELPPGATITLNWRVLLFTAAIATLSAMVFGLVPAWRASRVDPNTTLKSGGAGQGSTVAAHHVSQALVAVQVALSMVLLAACGLLSESVWKLTSAQLGYRTDHLFTAHLNLPPDRYTDQNSRAAFVNNLDRRLASLPGIQSATFGSNFVPSGDTQFSVQDDANGPARSATVATANVSPNYFSTLSIPLLRGRLFDANDRKDAQPVAIVSESLAKKYFPGGDALGRAIKLSRADDATEPWLTIIGVVADVKTTTVFQEMGYIVAPAVYRSLSQSAPRSLALMVAAQGSPLSLTSDIQRALSQVDGELVLGGIETMQAKHAAEFAQPRFRAVLSAGFGFLALVLAIIGLYGVLSRMVLRQTRDIGVRMALGANRSHVLRSVLRRASALTLAGVVLGTVGAIITQRLIRGLLYDVRSGGAAELTAVAVVLLIVALLAAWRPAQRAASVDPAQALRSE